MTATATPSDVRSWARSQGLTSAGRGPLPRSVLEAYAAAHAAAPAPTSSGDPLQQRFDQLEAQLASALARIAELEARAPRSLLGLNVTL